jgi:hypothetical protein
VNRVNFSEIGPELEDMRVVSISVYRLSSFKKFLLAPNHPLRSHSLILQYEDSKYYVKIETNSYQPTLPHMCCLDVHAPKHQNNEDRTQYVSSVTQN